MKIAFIFVLSSVLAFPNTVNTWRHDQCRYETLQNATWTDYEVTRTIRCAVDHWPVLGGVDKAISVAQCESGLEANSENGIYKGVYQQAIIYWDERFTIYSPVWWELEPSIWNARSNVIVSIRMVHDNGWNGWSCA